MFIDASLVFSDAQAVTVTAGSTYQIDTLAAGAANVGAWLVVSVDTAVTASGAATVTFSLQDSADGVTYTDVMASAAIGKATLIAGYEAWKVRIPPGVRRYLQVAYTVATGPLTAGKFNAYISKDADIKLT